jgi:uncharacterized protein YbjT (DUF2867 family)
MSGGAHIVTGAFGYSGRYIAQRLLDAGASVRTLTSSPGRPHSFGDRVAVHPYSFDDPPRLVESLRGAAVLYNTYWVRFNYRDFTHREAVHNTRVLIDAAREAGVQRIVHVSITNPSEDSPLEYFRGKAQLERHLIESGVPHAILRPAVLFGHEDILINNIAYVLRRLPIFGVFGSGEYRLRPIFVEDMADLAVEQGRSRENVIIDAVGPESFTFRELVQSIGEIIGKRRPIVRVPPSVGYWVGAILGRFVGDIVITREEIAGLMAGLLDTDAPAAGPTRLTEWAKANAATLGRRYASELARRRDRARAL